MYGKERLQAKGRHGGGQTQTSGNQGPGRVPSPAGAAAVALLSQTLNPARWRPRPGELLTLQRTIGNRAVMALLPQTVQRRTLTDHAEKLAYGNVLKAATSRSTTAGTANVLNGLGGIPGALQQKVRDVVTLILNVNTNLRAGNTTDLYESGEITAKQFRMSHNNDQNWLPAVAAPGGTGDLAQDAWAVYSTTQYAEITVDSSWRLVWDINNNVVYLTLHYDNDGTHSPFFEIQGLAL